MNSSLKNGLKLTGIVLLIGLFLIFLFRYTTKAYSPESTVIYQKKGLNMEVFYNRPTKKGRKIFGNLVPYNEVWRTGANEATTFSTNQDLYIDGSLLPAGKYSLWTIPKEGSWKVMFNSKMYPWGINLKEQASRDPNFDALVIEVGVEKTTLPIEQFSIFFDEAEDFIYMNLAWDSTIVKVPIKKREAP